MVDKQAMTQSEKLCDPCQFNTESVKAVSWCPTCEEGLCKSCEKSIKYNRVSNDPRSTLRLFYRYVRYNNLSHGYLGKFYPK
jgi:predicted amidophosphoribosyltransferase